ncbi:MAG: hypothetical protein A3F72_09625 [Bacteroidetes bacterium RIFCSPLOWO2_12_FULL_35_15]|nr:MAG: hypothetical protein A3F72_09625 [Bacteroidetes bacterium RIFCSPLOWO2_12_FULL_35_15]
MEPGENNYIVPKDYSREGSDPNEAKKPATGTKNDALNGGEKGSITTFVPDIDRAKFGNDLGSDEEILGHDLKHAFNRKHSLNGRGDKKLTYANWKRGEEIDAVNFQNVIRKAQHFFKTLRTSYGGKEIPKEKLTDPKDYKISNK